MTETMQQVMAKWKSEKEKKFLDDAGDLLPWPIRVMIAQYGKPGGYELWNMQILQVRSGSEEKGISPLRILQQQNPLGYRVASMWKLRNSGGGK